MKKHRFNFFMFASIFFIHSMNAIDKLVTPQDEVTAPLVVSVVRARELSDPNVEVINFNLDEFNCLSGDVEPSYLDKDTKSERLSIYRDDFNQIATDNTYCREDDDDSCKSQQLLIEKLKKDPAAYDKLDWDYKADGIFRMYITNFAQTSEEWNKAYELVDGYNKLLKDRFSDDNDQGIRLYKSPLSKRACFMQKVYNKKWLETHNTVADLIAVREECNQIFNDYAKSLQAHIDSVKALDAK